MELKFAFLAQNAALTDDSRLVAMGIDFDGIQSVGNFPLATQFNIVAKFFVDPDEANKQHQVQVFITKPGGDRKSVHPPMDINTSLNQFDPQKRSAAIVVINTGAVFERAGTYRFHIEADGQEVTAIDLEVAGPPAS